MNAKEPRCDARMTAVLNPTIAPSAMGSRSTRRRGIPSGKALCRATAKLAAPVFGAGKLYANLRRVAWQDDDNVFAVIWKPAD